MTTLPAIPTRPNRETTPRTYRLTPHDLKAIGKIRQAVKWLRTDTDALRYALGKTLEQLEEPSPKSKH